MHTAPYVARSPWREIIQVFLTLGALSPSGPGLTGVLQTEVQEKRGWLSQARFAQLLDGFKLLRVDRCHFGISDDDFPVLAAQPLDLLVVVAEPRSLRNMISANRVSHSLG